MTLIVTWSVFGVAVALTALSAWRGSRPPNPFKGPRLVPWRFLMLLFVAVMLVDGAFLVLIYRAD